MPHIVAQDEHEDEIDEIDESSESEAESVDEYKPGDTDKMILDEDKQLGMLLKTSPSVFLFV